MPQRAFPSKLSELPAVQDAILADVNNAGFADKAVFAIRLALDEALANAVRHGNGSDPQKQVQVDWSINDEAFTITVEDEGEGFDPHAVPDCTLDENLTLPSGRGVMLMKAYMSEVTFNDRGNRVTLVKRRDCDLPEDD